MVTVFIDAQFLVNNGLTVTSDARIIFRQNDNFMFEGNDGLLIDEMNHTMDQLLAWIESGGGTGGP